jgi:transposase, IS30 family
MPRIAPNRMPTAVKRRYFELLREGYKGAAAARVVGVSTSCGSLWLIDAGGVLVPDPGPISPRFLTQDDRIAIAGGLRAGHSKKEIAVGIGKSFQTVYREIQRSSKPTGRCHPRTRRQPLSITRSTRPEPSGGACHPARCPTLARWCTESRLLRRTFGRFRLQADDVE